MRYIGGEKTKHRREKGMEPPDTSATVRLGKCPDSGEKHFIPKTLSLGEPAILRSLRCCTLWLLQLIDTCHGPDLGADWAPRGKRPSTCGCSSLPDTYEFMIAVSKS